MTAGQATEVFQRHPLREVGRSFSLHYTDEDGSSRTLDLTCADEQQFELWHGGLSALVRHLRTLGAPVGSAAAAAPDAGTAALQPAPLGAGRVGGAPPAEAARRLREAQALQVRLPPDAHVHVHES